MARSSEFVAFVLESLQPLGGVSARRMFGGWGIYKDGATFALIAYETLYFKVDDGNRGDFAAAGMQAFSYEGRNRPIELSYYEAPPALMADPAMLADWAGRAHAAAKRAKAKKPGRKKKKA
jgi:DNA transformation protein